MVVTIQVEGEYLSFNDHLNYLSFNDHLNCVGVVLVLYTEKKHYIYGFDSSLSLSTGHDDNEIMLNRMVSDSVIQSTEIIAHKQKCIRI